MSCGFQESLKHDQTYFCNEEKSEPVCFMEAWGCAYTASKGRKYIFNYQSPILGFKKHNSSFFFFWESLVCFLVFFFFLAFFSFSFIFISCRLITSQHFHGFCHTLTWISHGVTGVPHPEPPLPPPSPPDSSSWLCQSCIETRLWHTETRCE